jgi:hypothetical protein
MVSARTGTRHPCCSSTLWCAFDADVKPSASVLRRVGIGHGDLVPASCGYGNGPRHVIGSVCPETDIVFAVALLVAGILTVYLGITRVAQKYTSGIWLDNRSHLHYHRLTR